MNDKYKRRAIVGQEMLIKRLETKFADADRKIKTLLAACEKALAVLGPQNVETRQMLRAAIDAIKGESR